MMLIAMLIAIVDMVSRNYERLVAWYDAPHRLVLYLGVDARSDFLMQLLNRQLGQLHGRTEDLV